MTITDHSPSAFYARGVEIDRLKKQWDEIDDVQSKVRVKLLRGTESDILADGSLDYPDAILEKLDVVIASIHSRHKMDEDAMTDRIVRAMRHPVYKIWGHALGRLVLRRDPIKCDMEKVLDAIARARAAIEISGDPNRLELEPKWIRSARARGIPFVISVDAHSTRALSYQTLGVHAARRGAVEAREVLNALPFERFKAAVKPA
jgi:DNA polymerase (family 10)